MVRGRATPDGDRVALGDGERLEADAVVWACGGWLPQLFPGFVTLATTHQDLFFLDGGEAWTRAPGWVDYDGAVYGTGDLDGLGVKGAPDFEGPPLAPDARAPAGRPGQRALDPRLLRAPLPGARGRAAQELDVRAATSCRPTRTSSPRRIPSTRAVWLLGGGSGHGFKHGPAMAERMAAAVRGGEPMPERFELGERAVGQSMRTAGSGR